MLFSILQFLLPPKNVLILSLLENDVKGIEILFIYLLILTKFLLIFLGHRGRF